MKVSAGKFFTGMMSGPSLPFRGLSVHAITDIRLFLVEFLCYGPTLTCLKFISVNFNSHNNG